MAGLMRSYSIIGARRFFGAVLLLVLVCLAALQVARAQAPEERRIALLIGNATYAEAVGPLQNPPNDVAELKRSLLATGFQERDIKTVSNARLVDLRREIDAFARRAADLRPEDIAFFYYSGHGAARDETGANYLIPVDAPRADTEDLWYASLPLDEAIATLKRGARAATFVVIDACRNELKLPRKDKDVTGSDGKAFAAVPNESGMLIAFAADQGQVARQGASGVAGGRLSPYAAALAQSLTTPNLPATAAFQAVRPKVVKWTGGKQEPVYTTKLNRDPVFLQLPVIAAGTGPGVVAGSVGSARPPPPDAEAVFWQSAKSCADYEAYLAKYPRGQFVALARNRLSEAPCKLSPPAAVPAALPDTRPPPSTRAAGLVARAGIVLKGHGYLVNSAAFSPDGTRIVTASSDKTARLWRAADGALLATLTGHEGWVRSAAFSPDGARIVTAGDKTARIWRVSDGALLATLTGHGSEVYSAAFSPEGATIVTASSDKTARIWRVSDGALLATLTGHGGVVTSAAFSPDGARIVTAGDKTARIWRVSDGALLATLTGHGGYVYSAAFSPDGAEVVTASEDKTARIWRAADGALLATLKRHEGWVWSAAFSPDGAKVVTASWDKTARIWRVSDGALLATLKGHEGWAISAAFSPDGAKVVTASSDKTARIWRAADGALLAKLEGHGGVVNSAAFSPDGGAIVTASSDNTARIWELGKP